MRLFLALTAALLLVASTAANAKTKNKKGAKAESAQQVVCTVAGCVPVSRGCGQTRGKAGRAC
ncbi:MAG: hypothetical protein K2Y27_27580 [Xanthobacteraceae bacterium]|nr:hypothetical protein [Xanthobacteraceae bacterium]